MNDKNYFQGTFFRATILLLWAFTLLACKTTQTTGVMNYAQGVDIAVAATAKTPAYRITNTVGAAGSGYAYLLEKRNGRWQVLYDSYDAKAFAKPVGDVKEVPADNEVLWTDGNRVVAYFGTEPLIFSKVDGSFPCPKNKDVPGHRACRSQFTVEKSLFDGLTTGARQRPFMLNIDEIEQAVAETGIVAISKKRRLAERQ